MPTDQIQKAFSDAAEIAQKLPKHLQEVAFNRALDHLLGKTEREVSTRQKRLPSKSHGDTNSPDVGQSSLLGRIDRTQYPDVGNTTRVADRALKVLQLANDDHQIDGLTAAAISEILTQKFRLPISANSVNMALEREVNTVDVRKTTEGVKTFRLMAPGEEYLKNLRSGAGAPRIRKAVAGSRKISENAKGAETLTDETHVIPKREARKFSSRPGPTSAVNNLLSSDFFGKARTVSEIQQELKDKRGHNYAIKDLAVILIRLLRDKSLNRERNAAGQYEYTKV